MQIIVSMEEVKQIVARHLAEQGFSIDFNSGDTTRHTEGSYEDSVEKVDGLCFTLTPLLVV
jgi:hypothetical protein